MREHSSDVQLFKAFCDVNRLQILKMLRSDEKCACKLLEELQIGQPMLYYSVILVLQTAGKTAKGSNFKQKNNAGDGTYCLFCYVLNNYKTLLFKGFWHYGTRHYFKLI